MDTPTLDHTATTATEAIDSSDSIVPLAPSVEPPSMRGKLARTVDPNEYLRLAGALRAASLHTHHWLPQIPKEPGLYAWYFRGLTGGLRTELSVWRGDWVLLYIGKADKTTLRERIRQHFEGDTIASGAVRECVGALLAKELFLTHRRIGGDWTLDRDSELRLTGWLHENARVAFISIRDSAIPWPRLPGESDQEVIARCELALINQCFILPPNRDQENLDVCRPIRDAWAACKQKAT